MPNLDYTIVDVFSTSALQGNPLAVVGNTCGLSADQMQAIAREFNLSETTFVERRDAAREQAEGVRVRIFTTREELNFAGHPTLGTASVLKLSAPETVRDNTVTLALNVGAVPVRFQADGLRGAMTQPDPNFGAELDAAQVAQFAGLQLADLDPALPPRIVSTGTAFAIVVLRSKDALARLRVDQELSTKYLRERGARWFYVLAPGASPGTPGASLDGDKHPIWSARMQFNGGEDPATGSAAGCAIAYLVGHGAVASEEQIHVRQGVEIGRPSDLYLSARRLGSGRPDAHTGPDSRSSGLDACITDVRVGGSTVLVAKGVLFLP